MPRSREEVAKTKHNFYQLAGFPGVIGCIDGSHIPIVAPPEDEFVFINGKGFHSINIQAVRDSNSYFFAMLLLDGQDPITIRLL